MPRGDSTGPGGLGPMTGRGLGYCADYSSPGYARGPGMGVGRGMGRGRGMSGYGQGLAWRRGGRARGGMGWGYRPPVGNIPVYNPYVIGAQPISPENQVKMLKQEKQYLESELGNINNALDDIGKKIEALEIKE